MGEQDLPGGWGWGWIGWDVEQVLNGRGAVHGMESCGEGDMRDGCIALPL